MRRKKVVLLVFLSLLILLGLSSHADATRSRLSGMGDLFIVIEDESNMINLWDFGDNPAGFLADEKGSTIREDMIREVYEIKDVECYRYVRQSKFPIWYRCNAEGSSIKGNISVNFRKNDKYAFGLEGNYLYRDRESACSKDELKYPEVSVVLSKNLGSLASIGADVQFGEYTTEMSFELTHDFNSLETKYLRTDVGVGRRFSEMLTMALLLGYESLDSDDEFYLSDFYTLRASAQSIVEIKNKMKLGLETTIHIRRTDFKYNYNGDDDYYYTNLRLRAIYNLTSRGRVGILYSDKELFSGYHYPLDSFFYPGKPEALTFAHWGIGCSYDFSDRVLAGLEYHFLDASIPNSSDPQDGLMYWSVNLGFEAKLTQAFSARTGYVWTGSTRNPQVFVKNRDNTEEHILTLGIGYLPSKRDLCFELAYSYVFKDFKQWYVEGSKYRPVESARHSLSASFKMSF